jgi:NADH-quinone oxidoreductase subunit C
VQLSEHEVPAGRWLPEASDRHAAGATMLDFLTAVDRPDAAAIELVAHLVDVAGRHRHLIRTHIPRDRPRVDSLVPVLPGAAWHEREVHELFGVRFDGNPDQRPLLTDGATDDPPLLRTTALPRRLGTAWPGALDPADRPPARPAPGPDDPPAPGPRAGGGGKVAARPRSRLGPPGIPVEWGPPPVPTDADPT